MRKITLILFISLIGFGQEDYPNLKSNIPYDGDDYTIDDVEKVFNLARSEENRQLGTNLPAINFPTQEDWDLKSFPEKALWLINTERRDRGIFELEGFDIRMNKISQDYADFLAENNEHGHSADGLGMTKRLFSNPDIEKCCSRRWENISYRVGYSSFPAYSVERSIYSQIYKDAKSKWGHRKNLLSSNFYDDCGVDGKEGALGVGVANATDYDGGVFNTKYKYATMVVFDIIDPCSSWEFK